MLVEAEEPEAEEMVVFGEGAVVRAEAVVRLAAAAEWPAAIIGVAAVGEFAVDAPAAFAVAAEAVADSSTDNAHMASWPRDTCSACRIHHMEMAEDLHYCTGSAGAFAHVDTAAAVYNAGTGQTQVVGSSSPQYNDSGHTGWVSSQTRGDDGPWARAFGPDKPPGGVS